MLSFVAVPFTNGSQLGMGNMTNLFQMHQMHCALRALMVVTTFLYP
jgi:hypothetical protein